MCRAWAAINSSYGPPGPLEAGPNLPVVGAGGDGEGVELEQVEELLEGAVPLPSLTSPAARL